MSNHRKYFPIGTHFGYLTVLSPGPQIDFYGEPASSSIVKCEKCNRVFTMANQLLSRNTYRSCGCYQNPPKHGDSKTRLYDIWLGMKKRCYSCNPNSPGFRRYKQRGISICDEWLLDFQKFKQWSLSHGYADNLSIDRINNDGNYCPENCRWVTQKVQCNNNSRNVFYTYNGITKSISEWARTYNLTPNCLATRLKKNIPFEKAIMTPTRKNYGRIPITIVHKFTGETLSFNSIHDASNFLQISPSAVYCHSKSTIPIQNYFIKRLPNPS